MYRPHTYAGRDILEDERVKFMGFLKGKSSLIIHERHANLKYKVDTVGKNTKKISEYIRNQWMRINYKTN